MRGAVGRLAREARANPAGQRIRELRKGKEVRPIVLIVVDVETKVRFHSLVDSFCLAICLRVVGSRELLLDPEGVGRVPPEGGGELVPSI